MGDESRIPIEGRVTGRPEQTGFEASGGGLRADCGAATTRVVHRAPVLWQSVAAVVVALVAGGVGFLVWDDGGGSAEPDRDQPKPATGSTATDPLGVPAPQAYSRAAVALEEAGSFAYRGVVDVAAGNPYLPPGWVGMAMIEGAAVRSDRETFASRETAVDATGHAFETVIVDGAAWGRAATNRGGLVNARWDELRTGRSGGQPYLTQTGENRAGEFGLTLLLAVQSAGERRNDRPDAAGRRVIRATLPADHIGEPWAGADVVLTLDDGGDIAQIAIASAPGRPRFEAEFGIVRIGESQNVVPPELTR